MSLRGLSLLKCPWRERRCWSSFSSYEDTNTTTEAPPSEPGLNLMAPEGPTPKCHHTGGQGFNKRMLWRGDTNIRSITLESTWMLLLSRWLQSWSGPGSEDRPTWVLPAQPPPFHPTPEITAVSPWVHVNPRLRHLEHWVPTRELLPQESVSLA